MVIFANNSTVLKEKTYFLNATTNNINLRYNLVALCSQWLQLYRNIKILSKLLVLKQIQFQLVVLVYIYDAKSNLLIFQFIVCQWVFFHVSFLQKIFIHKHINLLNNSKYFILHVCVYVNISKLEMINVQKCLYVCICMFV